jgi:periplasmic protein TonB
MFEAIVEKESPRGKRLSKLLGASLGLHGVALGVVLLVDQLRVGPVPEPAVTVSFVDFSAPPPPPPPPPAKAMAKKREPRALALPAPPEELVAPSAIPQQDAADSPAPAEAPAQSEGPATDQAPTAGVDGGVTGRTGGDAGAAEAPAGPSYEDVDEVKSRRIEGQDPAYPPLALSRRIEGVVVVRITVDAGGRVSDIQFMQTHAAFTRTVREAIARWRFQPRRVNGRAVAVYSVFRFTFKMM